MASNDSQTKKKIAINITDVTRHNVGQVKLLDKCVLPVTYSDKYYQDTVSNWPRENPWCRLAYHNEYLVGCINARIETYNPEARLQKVDFLKPGDTMVPLKQRKTKPPTSSDGKPLRYRLCITTFSVLPAYHNGGIGTQLLDDVLKTADSMPNDLDEIYLHVHVLNTNALEFYKKRGFEIVEKMENYFKSAEIIDPPDVYFLSRKIGGNPTKIVEDKTPE